MRDLPVVIAVARLRTSARSEVGDPDFIGDRGSLYILAKSHDSVAGRPSSCTQRFQSLPFSLMSPVTQENVQIVLIQVRERVDVEEQERVCFIERLGVRDDQVRTFNLVRDAHLEWSDVADADAVMIGGAGIYTAAKTYPFTRPLEEICRRLVDRGTPFFGACWGHQFLAQALGGRVVTDLDHAETGTNPVRLTEAGRHDRLFGRLPTEFLASMGHNDYIVELPPGGVELAVSDNCPVQAFRIADKPIYGTQFHSELTVDRLCERLTIYREVYIPDADEFARLTSQLRDTPDTDRILRCFLEECVFEKRGA